MHLHSFLKHNCQLWGNSVMYPPIPPTVGSVRWRKATGFSVLWDGDVVMMPFIYMLSTKEHTTRERESTKENWFSRAKSAPLGGHTHTPTHLTPSYKPCNKQSYLPCQLHPNSVPDIQIYAHTSSTMTPKPTSSY